MTKREFESICSKANLTAQSNEYLFEVVNAALAAIDTLDEYDGDAHEEN